MRNHGPRGLSGPAGGEENFEIAAAFVHSEREHDTVLSVSLRGFSSAIRSHYSHSELARFPLLARVHAVAARGATGGGGEAQAAAGDAAPPAGDAAATGDAGDAGDAAAAEAARCARTASSSCSSARMFASFCAAAEADVGPWVCAAGAA